MKDLIHRILYDKYNITIDDTRYLVKSPSRKLLFKSNEYYLFLLDKYSYDIEITEATLPVLLEKINLWTPEDEFKLKMLDEEISKFKEAMYDEYIISKNVTKMEKELAKKRKTQYNLLYRKHMLDYVTLEGFCRTVSNNYILRRTIKNLNNKKYLYQYNCVGKNFFKIVNTVKDNIIGETKLRKIARDNYWYGFWSIAKEQVFNKPVLELSDDQKQLIILSKMYDNIKNHPEAPEDFVINHDDLLDGWISKINRKGETSKFKNEMEKKLSGAAKNASDVFIVTSKDRARDVFEMNSPKNQVIVQERNNMIKQAGKRTDYSKIVSNVK